MSVPFVLSFRIRCLGEGKTLRITSQHISTFHISFTSQHCINNSTAKHITPQHQQFHIKAYHIISISNFTSKHITSQHQQFHITSKHVTSLALAIPQQITFITESRQNHAWVTQRSRVTYTDLFPKK